jgi:prolyl oligopeptidase
VKPYPAAARGDVVDVLHGEQVPDPYRWLEDPEHPQTVAWASAQADLLCEHAEQWSARPALHDRVAQLLRTGSVGTPVWRADRCLQTRRGPDDEHAVLLVREASGAERVLVDPMALDPAGTTTLDAWSASHDGSLVAYQTSAGGTEESTLTVLDADTGEVVEGPIDRCRYSPVAWLPDSRSFYYVRQLPADQLPADEVQYHRRVWWHRVGDDPAGDVLVFGADLDKTTFFGVHVSRDGRWLVVSAAQGTAPRNDTWLADLGDGRLDAPALRPVRVGVDARTSVSVSRDGRLYAVTDFEAPRGRLLVGDPEHPDPSSWRILVEGDSERVLEDVSLLDLPDGSRRLACAWTRHAVSQVTLHDAEDGTQMSTVPLPGLGSTGGLSARPEGGSELWFSYTDHVTPPTVLSHDAATGTTAVWATVPGHVPAIAGITARQVEYPSYDGTTVRMFVVSRSEPEQTRGPRPTLLYGYGGFGVSLTPAYAASILAWVEAGGIYAIANLRGGGEEGEEWHRAGTRGSKQRVFDDFTAAAEYLVDEGLTRPDLLAISGGSNGGLLVGAALTQRPDLFRAVVCSAPLLDMVRYEQHGLGRLWTDEYGTAADSEQLRWLLTYSPYHRVRPGTAYPAVLFTVFGSDTRVDPLHARKMTAALQAATTSDPATAPVLLRLESDAGHGARAVSRSVDLAADNLSFCAWATGLDRQGGPPS